MKYFIQLLTFFFLFSNHALAAITIDAKLGSPLDVDPNGPPLDSECTSTPYTTEKWREIGFEPLDAWGANPNDLVDDTEAIRNAVAAAAFSHRTVMAFWGTQGYIVTPDERVVDDGNGPQIYRAAIHLEQSLYDRNDDRHEGNFGERFATNIKGSRCGPGRPFLRVLDGVDDDRSFSDIASNPSVVVAFTRELYTATNSNIPRTQDSNNNNDPLDFTEGSRAWNQVLDGVDIVTGKNSGVVGVRHMGAEGSSIQNVTIDARGGFAGLYHLNSSGGYTHNVLVRGGQFGVFNQFARGGTILLNGVTFIEQEHTPFAINHYAPVAIVGANVVHDDGRIYGTVTGNKNTYQVKNQLQSSSHNAGGHVSFYDTDIEITGAGNPPILDNGGNNADERDRSVVFHNSCFKGTSLIVENSQGGNLVVKNTDIDKWSCVDEYAYSGETTPIGQAARFIDGEFTDNVVFNGEIRSRLENLFVDPIVGDPEDKQSKHLYDENLCNVEREGIQFITDHGAVSSDPLISVDEHGDKINNSPAITAAILAASNNGSNTVYVPRGKLIIEPQGAGRADHRTLEVFHVRDTIVLAEDVSLCGVARGTSTLSGGENGGAKAEQDINRWMPDDDSPIIDVKDSPTSKSALMRIQLYVPRPDSIEAKYVYAIDWSAGENSVVVDAWWRYDFGNPGRRVTVKINGEGGGKWYGVTQQGGYTPNQYNGAPGSTAAERRKHQSLRPYQKPVHPTDPVPDPTADFLVSPEVRHMVIEGTSNPLAFYSFHCQHIIIPDGGQCDIINSSNVTFHGIKQEAASVPEDMKETIKDNPADITPNWMEIRDSSNIFLNSYETHAEYACGRGAIEITDGSYNITAVNLGRRSDSNGTTTVCPPEDWGIIREIANGRDSLITPRTGYISMFKTKFTELTEPPVQISANDLTVNEDVGVANIVFQLDKIATENITVSYRTIGNTAGSGQGDLEFTQGEATIFAGSSITTVPVTILDDDVEENEETFFVDIQSVVSGDAEINVERSTVTILDDDESMPSPVFTLKSIFVSESNGTANVVVQSNQVLTEPVTFSYRTVNDVALGGEDFTAVEAQATMDAGRDRVTLRIPIIDDSIDEVNEAFSVEILNVVLGDADISNAASSVTIVDNDEPAPRPVFTLRSIFANEANGTANLVVQSDRVLTDSVTFSYRTVNNVALGGKDFTAVEAQATMGVGRDRVTLRIPIIDDSIDEVNEAFTVEILNVVLGDADISNASASVTIVDNDLPGVLSPFVPRNDVVMPSILEILLNE